MPHTETKLESKEIFDGHVIHVTLDTVRLEDGRTSLREVVHHHGGAYVLPIDNEPAGKLEPGEDPFESAKRELSEECGLSADNYIDLGVVYPTVGYDSEKIYLWAATGLHKGGQHLDAGEFLDVVRMPFEEALQKVLHGEIKDSKTQIGLMKYALLRDKA